MRDRGIAAHRSPDSAVAHKVRSYRAHAGSEGYARRGAGGHFVAVPEVTNCAGGLERAARRRYTMGMPDAASNAATATPRWRKPHGLDVAALITVAVIGFALWNRRVSLVLPGLSPEATVPLLLALFVGAYLLRMLRESAADGRWCLPATLVQAAAALALTWAVTDSPAPVLFIIVMAQLVTMLSRPAFVGFALALNGLLLWMFQRQDPGADGFIQWVLYAGFQAFAALTSHYAESAERSREDVAAVNAHLLATRSLLAESARDQERLRLSRELHDVAGHKLTALKLNLTALARDPALAERREVALSAQLADELLGDIRGVVRQLRLHEGMALEAAIRQLAAPLPRPRVHVAVAPDARVESVAQAEAVVRAVQEALTNAARHADAENVWVALRREGERITLSVRDDGRGSGALVDGHGLTGMRERLAALGGGLSVARRPEGGVSVEAWIPLVVPS